MRQKTDTSDIITRCIDEIMSGRSSLEDCQRAHSELRGELGFDLAVAKSIHRQASSIPLEFKRYARTHLFDEARPHFHTFTDSYAPARTK